MTTTNQRSRSAWLWGCLLLLFVFLPVQDQQEAFARHGRGAPTASLPAVPANVQLLQQGGTSNNLSNSQKIGWDAVSGATSYKVYRNGSLLASGVATTNYTDSTATNANVLAYNAPATAYTYAVSAVNGAGEGSQSTQYVVREYYNGVAYSLSGSFAAAFGYGITDNSVDATLGSTNWQIIYPGSGGGLQPYANGPLTPNFDLQIGAFNYLFFDFRSSTFSGNDFLMSLHSRVPLPVGDVFSDHAVHLSAYVTQVANTFQTYKIPLIDLGVGTTEVTGYISGSGSLTIGGQTVTISTLTVSSVTNGTVGTTIPGLDRGCQLIGLSGTTVAAGTYVLDMDGGGNGGGSGTGGTGTYTVTPSQTAVGSSGSPVPMRCVRDNDYKHDLHILGGSSGATTYFNNFGFSTSFNTKDFFRIAANDDVFALAA